MRIISKFVDVYDLQHAMRDESRIWERKIEVVYVRKQDNEDYGFYTRNYWYESLKVNFFFFCEEVYPLFTLKYLDDDNNEQTLITFDESKVIEIGEDIKLGLSYKYPGDTFEKRFKSLMSEINEQKPRIKEMFIKFNHPLGIYDWVEEALPDDTSTQKVKCHKLTFNPKLFGELPWQEIDSNVYRLHQRIEQYLSGVIGHFEATPATITTSDKDRLLAKGFDAVTSFRRMKRDA